YEAIAAARAALSAGRGAAMFRDWPLGPNLGQCCGGVVKTLTETFDATDMLTVRRTGEGAEARALRAHSPRHRDGPRAPPDRARRGESPRGGDTRLRPEVLPGAFWRIDHAGSFVRRRPCGARSGARARGASLQFALDRQPRRSVSAICAAECRDGLHRRGRPRIG